MKIFICKNFFIHDVICICWSWLELLKVPEGLVKLKYWEALTDEDSKRGVKRAFTLTKDHLDPSNYQKMSVPMAMKVRIKIILIYIQWFPYFSRNQWKLILIFFPVFWQHSAQCYRVISQGGSTSIHRLWGYHSFHKDYEWGCGSYEFPETSGSSSAWSWK